MESVERASEAGDGGHRQAGFGEADSNGSMDVFRYAEMNSDIGRCMCSSESHFDFKGLMRDTALILRHTEAAHAALGAFAGQALGVPNMRSTYDIDLVVKREDAEKLIEAAPEHNFKVVEVIPGNVWEFRHSLSTGEFSSVEKTEVFASGFQAVEDHPYRFEDPSGYSVQTPAEINAPDMPHALVHKALMPRGKDITDSANILRTLCLEERTAAIAEAKKILRSHGGPPGHEAEKRLETALSEAGKGLNIH